MQEVTQMESSVVSELEGTLLRDPDPFCYFMLIAFEASGLLRFTLLLVMWPVIRFLEAIGMQEVGLKLMIDQRYFLDDQKLKNLGWSESTSWEEGLRKTMEWYVKNPHWWGDVSGALLPHPRMLMVPGIERNFDGPDTSNSDSSLSATDSSQSRVVVPAPRSNPSTQKPSLKFLIYGKTGWIGGLLGKICEKQGIPFEYGRGRLQERSQLLADIQSVKPTHVFNAAGVTGRPNVDWCESHKPETIRTNVVGTINLADVCREHNLLMMNYATGCIFEYDAAHPSRSIFFAYLY